MMEVYPNLKADILKVGHHGSKGSTGEELIKQIEPKPPSFRRGAQPLRASPRGSAGHPKPPRCEGVQNGSARFDSAPISRRERNVLLHPPYDKVHSPQEK
ncbi:hypothetical protein PO124_17610 [Bacillus licheniformis]|nr:hypothetical protein [Bacillus licheniformis]